jgi:hypothetical protein
MNPNTFNSRNSSTSLLVLSAIVTMGACTVGPDQAVSDQAPYSAQVGAEYRVMVDDLHAYGVYANLTDKYDGKPISYATLIPGVGIGGTEIAWKKPIPRGSVVRILSAWRPRLLFGDRTYYRVAINSLPLPDEIPIKVYLYSNGGSGVDLKTDVYSRIDLKQ